MMKVEGSILVLLASDSTVSFALLWKEGMFMKKVVLLTGANGHLGRVLLTMLRRMSDCEIRALILPGEPGMNSIKVHYYHGDVCEPASLEAFFSHLEGKSVYVIHTAGIIDIQESVSPLLYAVNVTGTRNITELCLKHHVKRLLYTSSVHAIEEGEPLSIITETSMFSPLSVHGGYAKTKAQASAIVMEAVRQGLDAVIVHPSGILGPYGSVHNHLVQMVVSYMNGSLPAAVSGGFDFVDVRDVAAGCLLALEKGKAGECYILSNRYYTIQEVLEMVRKESGARKLRVLPIWLAKASLPFMKLYAKVKKQRPLYTSYTLYTLQSNARFSHDKATKDLGYIPRDLRKTIHDTVLWYQKQQAELHQS